MKRIVILKSLILFIIGNLNGQIPTDSLIGFWPFNGNANDLSINNNHGTVNGATLTLDRFGLINKAYHFDGNDYISIPHSITLNMLDSLSFSVWVKPEILTGTRMIFGKSNYTTQTNYLLRVKPNGYIQWEYNGYTDTDSVPLQLNTWHHVVVTASGPGQIKRVYIDNQLVKETLASTGPFGQVTNPFTIGYAGYNSEYFIGSIDDVRMYNKVLSVTEIDALFNESCNTTNSITETACDSYVAPDGTVYNTSGIITAVIPNSAGCDSIITIDLTVNSSSYNTDVQTACGTFTWIDGNSYTSSNNTATFTLQNSYGCDSVVTLDLTIYPTPDNSVTQNGIILTANQTGATYQWLDCDNGFVEINNETSQSFTPTQNGNYAVEVSLNGCADTSNCFAVASVGIVENTFNHDIIVFPNPTNGKATIYMGYDYDEITLTVQSLCGQKIIQIRYKNQQVLDLDLNVPNGIYFVLIESKNKKANLKIIKY